MAEQERLTARDPVGNAYFPECFKEPCGGVGCTKDHCVFLDSVCDKLAGYEEQGDQTEKLLAESEAARAELGKRVAAAQKMNAELTDAQAVMIREFEAKLEELEQVKAERDAAVRDLHGECSACEHVDTDCPAMNCRNGEKFKWRGTQKEEHHEKTDD